MTVDDVTAWAGIALGATVSVGATVLFLRADPSPAPEIFIEVRRVVAPAPAVDFAIIRSPAPVEIMVGPEGPSTGWVPLQKREVYRARPR